MATTTECFVFTSIGAWKNFAYTGVTGVVKVCNWPPAGETQGKSGRAYEEFTVGVDYEISGDQFRLIPNAKTNVYDYPYAYYAQGTWPFSIWVTYTISGQLYAPSAALATANATKMPNWVDALANKADLYITMFGDSTTLNEPSNWADRWECQWAMDLLAKYPQVNSVHLNFLGVGGTVSDQENFSSFDEEVPNSVPWLINNSVAGITIDRNTTFENFQTVYDSNSLGQTPDLILVTFINDARFIANCGVNFQANFNTFRTWIHTTKGWPGMEFVVIPGLVSNWTTNYEELRLAEIDLAASLSDTVCVDVSTVWLNLFARKTLEDVLANAVNHANSYSTIAYSVEMGAILPNELPPPGTTTPATGLDLGSIESGQATATGAANRTASGSELSIETGQAVAIASAVEPGEALASGTELSIETGQATAAADTAPGLPPGWYLIDQQGRMYQLVNQQGTAFALQPQP